MPCERNTRYVVQMSEYVAFFSGVFMVSHFNLSSVSAARKAGAAELVPAKISKVFGHDFV